jgi:hypothetical protein
VERRAVTVAIRKSFLVCFQRFDSRFDFRCVAIRFFLGPRWSLSGGIAARVPDRSRSGRYGARVVAHRRHFRRRPGRGSSSAVGATVIRAFENSTDYSTDTSTITYVSNRGLRGGRWKVLSWEELEALWIAPFWCKVGDKFCQGRIRTVLELMDERMGDHAASISSRAVAVSAYLIVENLVVGGKEELIAEFGAFYVALLDKIKAQLKLLSNFREPTNPTVLEGFQRHISQASVEPFAIRSRDSFLENAFRYYREPRTKGRIIGSRA